MLYNIFTFSSTHHVLKAEKLLSEKGIAFDIIPTPKDISSDCGMSIRMQDVAKNLELASEVLNEHGLKFSVTQKTDERL